MTNIKWGPEIKVNGERPAWLGDGDKFNWCGCTYVGISHLWEGVSSIRLPADHWAYAAIKAGFEPWGGGDSAPEDWTGNVSDVLEGDGTPCPANEQPRWEWLFGGTAGDAIGYRKRTEPQAGDTVTIQRLPESEWDAMYRDYGTIEVLRSLGLIKPEPTKAERIAADTGIDLATVERVLAAAS